MMNGKQRTNTDKSPGRHHLVHEIRTAWVVVLTTIAMAAEILFGYLTHSMALLTDGYHMASHVLALGLTWLAYRFARKYSESGKISFSRDKLLALAGFSSAILLQIIAILMAYQAIVRLLEPVTIRFREAIIVAVIGLVVNVVSAVILHHKEEQSDHNIRSAYLHVLADGLTSIMAIIALTAGYFYNIYSLDALSGIISSIVITKWSAGLIINSGKEIIEFNRNP